MVCHIPPEGDGKAEGGSDAENHRPGPAGLPATPLAGSTVLRPPPVAKKHAEDSAPASEARRIQAFANPVPALCCILLLPTAKQMIRQTAVLLHWNIFIQLHMDPGAPQIPPVCSQISGCCAQSSYPGQNHQITDKDFSKCNSCHLCFVLGRFLGCFLL